VPIDIHLPSDGAINSIRHKLVHSKFGSKNLIADIIKWVQEHPDDVVKLVTHPHFSIAIRSKKMLEEYRNSVIADANCVVFFDISGKFQ
jgi:hypothetical protein